MRGSLRVLVFLCLAPLPSAAQPVRVSVSSAGLEANGRSWAPSVSDTGRFVAFLSEASNLVPGDTNGASDVFVRDRDTDGNGVFDEPAGVRTERVSVDSAGNQANGPSAIGVVISGDGRYVVFESAATNLTPTAVSGIQIYRHDRRTRQTTCVSRDSQQQPIGGAGPSISRDGRFVVFLQFGGPVTEPWVVPDARPYLGDPVVLRDMADATLARISAPLPPLVEYWEGPHGYRRVSWTVMSPRISADGRRVVYTIVRREYGWSPISVGTVMVHDRTTGATTNHGPGFATGLSGDGRTMARSVGGAWPSAAADFVDVDTGRGAIAYGLPWPTIMLSGSGARALVYTSLGGVTDDVSVTRAGPAAVSLVGTPEFAVSPSPGENLVVLSAVDADGRFFAFSSRLYAPPPDGNDAADVFVTDLTGAFDRDRDGLDDHWESSMGLAIVSGTGADGPDGDPDADGRTNRVEQASGGHPRATTTQHLAEGARSAFFSTRFAVLNPGTEDRTIALRHLIEHGPVAGTTAVVRRNSRYDIVAVDLPEGIDVFGTLVESTGTVVVERAMTWGGAAHGAHGSAGSAAPATTWYFAEGATSDPFDLFYLLLNPNVHPVDVTIRFLRPDGRPPMVRTYSVAGESRRTVYVGSDDPALRGMDLGAVVEATGPIVAERSMYLRSRPPASWQGGHTTAGVTAPALEWFLPEGATGDFFDLFVLLANPGDRPADVDVTCLTEDGRTFVTTRTLLPFTRTTIWVDRELQLAGSAFAGASVSTVVRSTNGVPIVAERTMWWPGGTAWTEGHNSFGATQTATRWATADANEGGPANAATYILVANPTAEAASIRISLADADGIRGVHDFTVSPQRRLTLPVRALVTHLGNTVDAGLRLGAIVEVVPDSPGRIVVERATYWNAGGALWSAGTSALATPLP